MKEQAFDNTYCAGPVIPRVHPCLAVSLDLQTRAMRTLLYAHAEVLHPERHVAVDRRLYVELHEPWDGDLTRQPRLGVEPHFAGSYVPEQRAQIRQDPVNLHRRGEVDHLRPPRWDPAGRHRGLPDLATAVAEADEAVGAVGEGDVVGVVEAHEQVEGDVDVDARGQEGEVRRGADDADGDEGRRGVADLEDGEGEDQSGDREENEDEKAA